jgi:hypothetical protein
VVLATVEEKIGVGWRGRCMDAVWGEAGLDRGMYCSLFLSTWFSRMKWYLARKFVKVRYALYEEM